MEKYVCNYLFPFFGGYTLLTFFLLFLESIASLACLPMKVSDIFSIK